MSSPFVTAITDAVARTLRNVEQGSAESPKALGQHDYAVALGALADLETQIHSAYIRRMVLYEATQTQNQKQQRGGKKSNGS
jgi:hypothetical protein